MLKRWLSPLALVLVVLLTWPPQGASAQTPGSTTVYVDGQRVTTSAIMQNGLQLVPAAFFRGLNASVGWSERYRSAVITTASIQIGFAAGERYADYQRAGEAAWLRDSLDTRTTLIGGSAYVPLAYTAKKIGLSVHYDERTRSAVLSTGDSGLVVKAQSTQTSAEELNWLYKITEAEAGGESYAGKVAVAASILNRVASPDWPDTITDTIFQVEYINGTAYYQYSPVLDKRIYSVTPSQETRSAVQAALNGSDPGLGAVVFYNPDKTDNAWVRSRPVTARIGNHVFAK
ncbi:cell wall hydrolase [Cohnella thailandensis]|uniref:Cell wall hydrolase n=1 Tax=Cohnella thailandensis TaxID=557557 RepID=A0A841SVP2_9BACL|nr:cell wall hydrolase [Cohnella thailandensis]MBP1972244.1 spore germination cell wall hydrolase CwlJ-like protein [Cohnella thailandensis]